MKDEVKFSVKEFKKAFARLQEGVRRANSDLTRDGVVQRFEFTFELLWKTLKVILEDKGVIATTPKDCLQAAFRHGWIADDIVFVEMLEARNTMSHQYNEAEAQKVFKQIKKRFLKPIKTLLEHLESL